MNFPSLQVNDFFQNPNSVVDYVETLRFEKPPGNYPGLRALAQNDFDHDFFQRINLKIVKLLYSDFKVFQTVGINAHSYFQKIKYEDVEAHMLNCENPGRGWIHNDHESKFTSIIYLSKHENCGTALYTYKDEAKSNFKSVKANPYYKDAYYRKDPNLKLDEYYAYLNEHLNQYKLDCLFNSAYNKMIGFDGGNAHGALYNLKPGEERLIFISFFHGLIAPYYPVPEMNRI
jgi:hypothetical protein